MREEVLLLHGHVNRIADGHVIAHPQHRIFVDCVASGACDDAQRLHQWHAGLESHCRGACEAGDRAVVHDLADHGDLQD
ncbi:hypothetical protein D3C81_1340000 [compost metagenome]